MCVCVPACVPVCRLSPALPPCWAVRETQFVAAASRLRVGPGTNPSSDLGPVISVAAKKRVLALIDSALAEGATLLLDGRNIEVRGNGMEGVWVLLLIGLIVLWDIVCVREGCSFSKDVAECLL